MENLGFPFPAYSNPSDYLMKLMNEEGMLVEKVQKGEKIPAKDVILQEFQQRVELFVKSYK